MFPSYVEVAPGQSAHIHVIGDNVTATKVTNPSPGIVAVSALQIEGWPHGVIWYFFNVVGVTPGTAVLDVRFFSGVTYQCYVVVDDPCLGSPKVAPVTRQAAAVGKETSLGVTVYSADATPSFQWYEGRIGDFRKPLGTQSLLSFTPTEQKEYAFWARVSDHCGIKDVAVLVDAFNVQRRHSVRR